ncbi:MAG TPA: hypothetical protein VNN21_04835 [Dehalococcoidia bacterium]|nr:hypothetical protein [Dehalococcoidia bacterium]
MTQALRSDVPRAEEGASDLVALVASRAEAARRIEVERTLRRLRHLPEADKRRIEELSRQIVSAIVGRPLGRLASSDRHREAARELFGLE